MGELRLTGLDEEMLAGLSRMAAAHGRSTVGEAGAILKAEIARSGRAEQMSEEEWLVLSAESRRQTGRLSEEAVDLIREDRDER